MDRESPEDSLPDRGVAACLVGAMPTPREEGVAATRPRPPASTLARLWSASDAQAKIVGATLALGLFATLSVAALVFHFTGEMGPDSGARFLMIRNWARGGDLLFLSGVHEGPARITNPFAGYVVYVPRGACTVYPAAFPALTGILYRLFGAPGLVLLPGASV